MHQKANECPASGRWSPTPDAPNSVSHSNSHRQECVDVFVQALEYEINAGEEIRRAQRELKIAQYLQMMTAVRE